MKKNVVEKIKQMADLFEEVKNEKGFVGISDVRLPDITRVLQFDIYASDLKQICETVRIEPFIEKRNNYTMKAVGILGNAQLIAIRDDELRLNFPNEVAEYEGGKQNV